MTSNSPGRGYPTNRRATRPSRKTRMVGYCPTRYRALVPVSFDRWMQKHFTRPWACSMTSARQRFAISQSSQSRSAKWRKTGREEARTAASNMAPSSCGMAQDVVVMVGPTGLTPLWYSLWAYHPGQGAYQPVSSPRDQQRTGRILGSCAGGGRGEREMKNALHRNSKSEGGCNRSERNMRKETAEKNPKKTYLTDRKSTRL